MINALRCATTVRGIIFSLTCLLSGCVSFGPEFTECQTRDNGGCAPLTPGSALSEAAARNYWQQHSEQLTTLTHWQIMGKIALFGQDQRIPANLYWQQYGDDYEITISNLFGTPWIEIKKQGALLWLRVEQEQTYWGSDPEQLIKRLTGWQLPIKQMPLWLKGLPGDADYLLSNHGVVEIAQLNNGQDNGDWKLQYNQYKTWQHTLLPSQLIFSNQDNKIKLAISEWKIKQ